MTNRERELTVELHKTRLLLGYVCKKCPEWEARVNKDKKQEIRRVTHLPPNKPKWIIHNGYKYVLEENSND